MSIAIAAETATFSGRAALGFEGALFNPAGTSELWRLDETPDLLINLWANEDVGEAQCKNIVVTGRSINASSNEIGDKKLYIEEIISIAPLPGCEFTNGREISTPNDFESVTFIIEKYREKSQVYIAFRREFQGEPPDTDYRSWIYDCVNGTYRFFSGGRSAEDMRATLTPGYAMGLFKEGTSGYDVGQEACQ